MKLNGTILVTGAYGILGRAISRAIAEAGATVLAADLPDVIEEQTDARIVPVPLDLNDADGFGEFAARLEATHGPLEGLVNNAATKGSDMAKFMRDALAIDRTTWSQVTSVNLDGTFFLTRELARAMIGRGRGTIVFIGSIYGEMGPDPRIYEGSHYCGQPILTPPVYSATKAAISGLTRYLAATWGGDGLRVNCVCPGGVASGQNDVFQQRYSSRVPLQRMARPNEIADPIVFLLSDKAAYITGQTMMVDGGLSIW